MHVARVGRWLLGIVVALLLVSALTAVFCLIFFQTDRGRQFAGHMIEKFVTKSIPGKLRIGKIERFGTSLVIADDVRFYHPDGRLMLLAKHAEVVPDIGMALHGRLGFKSAAVDGGFILLQIDPDGRLGMEATMNQPLMRGETNDDPYGGLHYWMRAMHTQHFTTTFHMGGQTLRLRDTTGFVGIRRIDTQGVQVVLDHISGSIEEEIAGARVAFNDVTGWVYGKEQHVAHFDADTKLGNDGKLVMTIDYFDRKQKPMKVQIHKTKGFEATAMSWLLKAAGLFTGEIDVEG